MKYKKGETLLMDGRLYTIRNCHKNNTYTVIHFYTKKIYGRLTEERLSKSFKRVDKYNKEKENKSNENGTSN